MTAPQRLALEVDSLTVIAGGKTILRDIRFTVQRHQVFVLIGASGAGKSTLLKSLNRLLELNPQYRVTGDVRLAGQSIYAPAVDVDELRTRVGILFQQPVVFPKSIFQNVILGTRHHGKVARQGWPAVVERALREAALWDEVKDRLHDSALRLSVGQQQRLCLARTLAVDPEVVLMDEPTSALDPRSTEAIEELILRLKATRTIVLVTHNFAQARRVADWLTCLSVRDGAGEIAQSGCCADVLSTPPAGQIDFRPS
jgi:phosphate transport system ATP-binding protein